MGRRELIAGAMQVITLSLSDAQQCRRVVVTCAVTSRTIPVRALRKEWVLGASAGHSGSKSR
jgi:hypothetical protein